MDVDSKILNTFPYVLVYWGNKGGGRRLLGEVVFQISKSKYESHWYSIKHFFGWYSQRCIIKTIFFFLIWMALGVVYGMVYEKWSFITSLYFSGISK